MLRAQGLSKRFGGLAAVDDVSFSVAPGAILGLIGPNGAGKSTLVNLVTGFERPDAGVVELDGVALNGVPPARRARLGLSRTFQRPRLVADVTVEHLLIGAAWIPGRPRWLLPPRRAAEAVGGIAAELGLEPLLSSRVEQLASPALRLVQIAMAALTGCRYLMLDEPVAGLGAQDAARVGTLIRALAARGTGIVLIEHNVGFVRELAQQLLVIDRGRSIAAGEAAATLSDPRVIEAYLGTAEAS